MNRMRTELKYQVVWQVVDAWIKLKDLNIVKQKDISFKECISGFFHYMSVEGGLSESIVIHPTTMKPAKAMDAQLAQVTSEDAFQVTFIPRVPGLVLASANVIKAASDITAAKTNKRQRTNGMSVTGRHSSKIINTYQPVVSGQGFRPIVAKSEQKSMRMLPSMMKVQGLYYAAICEAKNINELMSRCIDPVVYSSSSSSSSSSSISPSPAEPT